MPIDHSKHRILFLAANPAATPRLALDEECRAIQHELRLASDRGAFEFHANWAVDIHEMMRHLNEFQPTVIHFSGHGGHSGELHISPGAQPFAHRDIEPASRPAAIHLHGETQGAQGVSALALAAMIRTAAPSTVRPSPGRLRRGSPG